MRTSIFSLVLLVCLGSGHCVGAQGLRDVSPGRRLTFGVEQDVLPYVLKGWIGTGWIGAGVMRVRFSYAQATQPKFFLGDGILKDRVQAFGISTEFFFREGFKGWWLGPGIGYWTDVVDTQTGKGFRHESVIFSFGGGYLFELKDWLYVSTWTALHTRVSGNIAVDYGGVVYKPGIVTPEVSVKLGVKFPRRRKTHTGPF